jgi:antiviral helicase SLH1
MASSNLSAAEAQWREQYAAMRAALADLQLPSSKGKQPMTNGDIDETDFEGYSSGTSGQDVWDFISDEDDDPDSSDYGYEEDVDGGVDQGAEWFVTRCSEIAAKNGMPADVFESQVSSMLSSALSDEELQMQLTDLIGFNDLDFIIEMLARKDSIVAVLAEQNHHDNHQLPSGRLLNRAQREAALRRRDLEHKSATLAPAQTREVQYPHVYKAYNAGNTLNHAGKKYGLPSHERLQFDKYEEYAIPAGKKGELGPGQRLVKISELDGLGRTTFKGYKTLNRMQSLVYPVAYKTSENMLICAPTGAVSS